MKEQACAESYSFVELGLHPDDVETDGSWTCGVCRGTHVKTKWVVPITRLQVSRFLIYQSLACISL